MLAIQIAFPAQLNKTISQKNLRLVSLGLRESGVRTIVHDNATGKQRRLWKYAANELAIFSDGAVDIDIQFTIAVAIDGVIVCPLKEMDASTEVAIIDVRPPPPMQRILSNPRFSLSRLLFSFGESAEDNSLDLVIYDRDEMIFCDIHQKLNPEDYLES